MSQSDLVTRFHQAMLDIYRAGIRLKKPYHATVLLAMVNEHGGKDAADLLLAKNAPSYGFTELYRRGPENLKISVEYLVLQNPWRGLFTDEQLAVARERLREVNCELPPDDFENLDSSPKQLPSEKTKGDGSADTPEPNEPQRGGSMATHTTATRLASEIDVELRHNLLKQMLVMILKSEFPGCPVEPERPVAGDRFVDVAVDMSGGTLFCEIKVAPDVRTAVREAIGQLLEYSHWPADRRATKWWVMSEGLPSPEEVAYLQALRSRYGLPMFYRRIDIGTATLGPET